MPTRKAQLIDIGDGVKIPAEITVTTDDVNGYEVTLVAAYTADGGRYEVRSLTVRGGGEVTGKALREIPVATILRNGVLAEINRLLPPLLSAGLPPERLRGAVQEQMFRWVAARYRLALLLGDSPTQAVANSLDVPRSTAGRWVTRTRDRGLLTVRDPRGGK